MFVSFFLIIDIMKSEERQKLAKERREEKAKYLGKWTRGALTCYPLHRERAPSCVGVKVVEVLCCYELQAADGMHMLHWEGKMVVWAADQKK